MTETRSIEDFSPEAQAYIKELRSESAQYRTERNTFRDKSTEFENKYSEAGAALKAANEKFAEFSALPDKVETLNKSNAELATKLQRQEIAWANGLTPDDAPRLQGATPEEWTKDAEGLAARLGKPRGLTPDPAAGKTPADPPKDPILAAFDKALGLSE